MKRLLIAFTIALLAAAQLFIAVWAAPGAVTRLAGNPCPDVYVVKYGDTLSQIAEHCATTLQTLRDANPAIRTSNRIYVGQKLVIRIDLSTPPAPTGDSSHYIVQRGDTLSQIAQRYGTTVREMMRLNADIDMAWLIYEDQVLSLPEGSNPAAVNLSTGRAEAGDQITVNISGFPGYAAVDYRVGKEDSPYNFVVDSKTNVNGENSLTITIPSAAKVNEKWVVRVVTTDRAEAVDVTSHTITILPPPQQ